MTPGLLACLVLAATSAVAAWHLDGLVDRMLVLAEARRALRRAARGR